MLSTKAPAVSRERVTEELAEQYGPEELWQAEQLSRNIFRAWAAQRPGGGGLDPAGWLAGDPGTGGSVMPGIKNPRGPGKTAGSCFKEAHHENICIIPRIRYQCKGVMA